MHTLRNAMVGLVAGAIGTAAMDLVWYRRYRKDGGKDSLWPWETAVGATGWDQVSAPGQLGEKALRGITGHPPPDSWARATTNAVHWGTGIGWGVQYGLLLSLDTRRTWPQALALGPAAWSAAYVLLPVAKVYKPIWQYDARTLTKDFTAHVVYGGTTAAAFGFLARQLSERKS